MCNKYTSMEGLPTEVAIYIRKIKEYLKTDTKAKEYLIIEGNEDFFFEHLTKISMANYETNGDAHLTMDQFEVLRNTIILVSALNTPPKETIEDKVFFYHKSVGRICLN